MFMENTLTIEYKVMKDDCTSLIGLVVTNRQGQWKFIEKEDIKNHTYNGFIIDKVGKLRSGKGSSNISFRKGRNIIVPREWIALQETHPISFKEFEDNLRKIRIYSD